MNKKYMDFLPPRPIKDVHQQKVARSKSPEVTKKVSATKVGNVGSRVTSKAPKILKEPTLGIVEDRGSKFVKTEVPKRPLDRAPHFRLEKSELTEAKAKKVGNQVKKVETKKVEKVEDKKTYKPPKTPFINQEKVVKRPLSKNVYQKKIEVPKEEPKGPVTIITKPEKDAHVSLIVTIILTIILGAAAGTVAFLLLPK